ncbi:MAG: nitrogen regulation protein NR(II) [Sandaracinaceae bacterium]
MNDQVALLHAWSGVYAFVAGYYGLMQLLRRHLVHGRFAVLCGSLALYTFGLARSLLASDAADGLVWQQAQLVAFFICAEAYAGFVSNLIGVSWPRVSRALRALAIVGVGAVAAGLFFDPGSPDFLTPSPLGMVLPSRAKLTAVGGVLIVPALVALFGTSIKLASAANRERDLRGAALLTVITLAGATYDLASLAGGPPPLFLMGHLGLLPVLGFSYTFIGRFTRVDVELETLTKQLSESYRSLGEAQDELVKKEQMAAVGELSAVVAHELRNPLAIVKNAVSGLRREELAPDDAETLLQILDEEGDRLNRLVSDLLAYAKPISPEAAQVDLRALVMRAVELAAGGRRGIDDVEIELQLDAPVAPVEGDGTLLRHALLNIVDNALQAMPSGGTLTVSCRDADHERRPCVAVDFHDTGEGMDTLVRAHARDPFFTTREQGTGLGLAIVERVARAHGGHVEIESRHGRGTTVSFFVPVERSSMAPFAS